MPSGSSSAPASRPVHGSAPTVVVDTNALFLPVRRRFPLESEIDRLVPGARIVVPTSVLRELDRLGERATPAHRAARTFAERFPTVVTAAEGDRAILEVAVDLRASVVTADRALQRELLAAGCAVLAPRDRHRLELRPAGATGPRGARTVKNRPRS